MAEKEATLRLQGDYAADIRMCDRIETEPPRMADDMFAVWPCAAAERTTGDTQCTQSANSGVDR